MMIQPMIEQLNAEDYSFFLAHGVPTDAELQEQEITDLLMYTDVEM
jgi:hypothetical protein